MAALNESVIDIQSDQKTDYENHTDIIKIKK